MQACRLNEEVNDFVIVGLRHGRIRTKEAGRITDESERIRRLNARRALLESLRFRERARSRELEKNDIGANSWHAE